LFLYDPINSIRYSPFIIIVELFGKMKKKKPKAPPSLSIDPSDVRATTIDIDMAEITKCSGVPLFNPFLLHVAGYLVCTHLLFVS